MLVDGLNFVNSSSAQNITIEKSDSLPATSLSNGRLFMLTSDYGEYKSGLFVYHNTTWIRLVSISDMDQYAPLTEKIMNFPGSVAASTGVSRFYFRNNVQILEMYVWASTPPTSTMQIRLNNNGTSVATCSLTAGQNISPVTNVNVVALAGSYITVDVLSPGGAKDVGVKIIFK